MLFLKRFLLRCLRNTKKSRIRRRNDRNNLVSEAMGVGCSDVLGKQKRVKSNKNKVRKKRKITGNSRVVDRNGEIDRISELPESIIHHILSFLHCPKDIVRTAVLSRNWNSMFNSYHSFDFDEKWFRESRGRQKPKFRSYVEKSIATRLMPLVSIDKFRLCVDNFDDTYMERWIKCAIDKNVKELDIQVHKAELCGIRCNLVGYPSIISVKLLGNMAFNVIKLRNLRKFSIKGSRLFTGSMMQEMAENCPLLEDLRFVCCSFLSYISIKSLVKLRRLEVQDCAFLLDITIASSNPLESFWYHATENTSCNFDLGDTENLKNLTLKDSMMSDSLFEDWIVRCPSLEKLVLHECTMLEKIKISSEKLKSLAIIKCVKLSEASIDAPNLCSLEYSGRIIPFRSMNASRLHRVKLSIFPIQMKELYHNMFGDFDGIKGLKLILYSKLNMKIFEDPREVPEDENSLQKLELTASSTSVVKTIDNWLRERQGKSLTLISSNDELMKLISGMIMERDDRSCCGYYGNKCWRHYMTDVKVSTLEIGKKTCYDFTWTSKKI